MPLSFAHLVSLIVLSITGYGFVECSSLDEEWRIILILAVRSMSGAKVSCLNENLYPITRSSRKEWWGGKQSKDCHLHFADERMDTQRSWMTYPNLDPLTRNPIPGCLIRKEKQQCIRKRRWFHVGYSLPFCLEVNYFQEPKYADHHPVPPRHISTKLEWNYRIARTQTSNPVWGMGVLSSELTLLHHSAYLPSIFVLWLIESNNMKPLDTEGWLNWLPLVLKSFGKCVVQIQLLPDFFHC